MEKSVFKNLIYLIISVINAGIMALYLALSPVSTIPMHFGFEGKADRYGSKWELLLLMCIPVVFGIIYAIAEALKKYMCLKSENKKYADKIIAVIFGFIIVLLWLMSVMCVNSAITENTGIGSDNTVDIILSTILALLGVVIIFISNLFPKLRQNDAFGIRTRATTSSEYVWKKAHRLGAYTGVFGGLAMIVCSIIGYAVRGSGMIIFYVGIGIMLTTLAIIPAVYANRLYKKELDEIKNRN